MVLKGCLVDILKTGILMSRKRVAIEAQTPKPRKICLLFDVRKHDYRIHMLYRIFYLCVLWISLCTLVARSQLFAGHCIQVLMSSICHNVKKKNRAQFKLREELDTCDMILFSCNKKTNK